jgi:hypothetical protein
MVAILLVAPVSHGQADRPDASVGLSRSALIYSGLVDGNHLLAVWTHGDIILVWNGVPTVLATSLDEQGRPAFTLGDENLAIDGRVETEKDSHVLVLDYNATRMRLTYSPIIGPDIMTRRCACNKLPLQDCPTFAYCDTPTPCPTNNSIYCQERGGGNLEEFVDTLGYLLSPLP